jgi:murein DD-endopeptidase MepM/ murein hydrolase activator NlpD
LRYIGPAAAAATVLAAQPGVAARTAATRYVFPVACERVHYSGSHHDYPAADMFARTGCPFVSPVDGVVDEVSRTDRWQPGSDRAADRGGRSVSIVGADGVRYYGSHLSAVAHGIRRGVAVHAGDVLGRVGHSGNARYVAPHLHFGISWPTGRGEWWVRRGEVWPKRYLDAWRDGRQKSPASAVAAARQRASDEAHCTRDC